MRPGSPEEELEKARKACQKKNQNSIKIAADIHHQIRINRHQKQLSFPPQNHKKPPDFYENQCPITLEKLSLKESYLVNVSEKREDSTYHTIYYIGDEDTLEDLSFCPITRIKGVYGGCRLSALNNQQRKYITTPNNPNKLREDLGGNLNQKDRKNDKQWLTKFPWKARRFNQTPPSRKLPLSIIKANAHLPWVRTALNFYQALTISNLLALNLTTPGIPIIVIKIVTATFFLGTIVGIVYLIGALISTMAKSQPRCKNHLRYETEQIKETISLVKQVSHRIKHPSHLYERLEAVDTSLRFIQAICRSYSSFMREHPTLQTTGKWLSAGLWNHVSCASKELFQLLRNQAIREDSKLEAIRAYLRTPKNQGKALYTTIITKRNFLTDNQDTVSQQLAVQP